MNLIEKAKRLFSKSETDAVNPKANAKAVSAIPQEWLDAAQTEAGLLMSREAVEAARQAESARKAHDVNITALRQAMLNNLSEDVLAEVAVAIGFAPSQLFGGKGRKVMGLLQSAEKNGLVTELLSACQNIMPDVNWQ